MNEPAGERSQCCNRCYVWTVRILCLPVYCVIGALGAVAFVLALPVLILLGPCVIGKVIKDGDGIEEIQDYAIQIGYVNVERGGLK